MYEYACEACDVEFEQLVRTAREEKSVKCPQCGGGRVRRKLSVFAPRSGAAPAAPAPRGCGRCGDPDGPCGL